MLVNGLAIDQTMCYRHSSVGVICISVYRNEIYILLGKEQKYKNQRFGYWCSFGGHPHPHETYIETATREFMEECICTVQFDRGRHYSPKDYGPTFKQLLVDKKYNFFFKILIGNVLRIYYVITIPWQPHIVEHFQARRKQLLYYNTIHEGPFSARSLPGVHIVDDKLVVDECYLEKPVCAIGILTVYDK